MKVQVVGYGATKHDWWVGISMLNFSPDVNQVSIKIFDPSGIKRKDHSLEFQPFQQIVLGDKEDFIVNSRQWVMIEGPDSLIVVPYQGRGTGGFGILPVKEAEYLGGL